VSQNILFRFFDPPIAPDIGFQYLVTIITYINSTGRVEGETRTLAKTAIRLLSKKFGSLTEDTRQKIENLDKVTL
jgi:hypothetical protein